MGSFSRSKGRRGEQELVLYLAKYFWKAEIILRQYLTGGQPDVIATKNGRTITFEMKTFRASFKTIYDLYYAERGVDGVLRFELGGTCVALGTHFEDLDATNILFSSVQPDNKRIKVYQRIVRMREMKQAADYLCVKDNNKPKLFLRYW